MKVKLIFQSPLIVGGRKLASNYIESLDYIQGNVVRAALVKHILNNCSEYIEDKVEVVNGIKRKHWVYFRDREGCTDCKYKSLCSKFSDLTFSFFYPERTEVLPLTAMRCKTNEEHGFIDCLIHNKECKVCKGRVEFVTGYVKDGSDYSVVKENITKTGINRYTQSSKDGSLYSIVAVTETSENKNIFEGNIDGLTKEEFQLISELRVGKYLSIGFGKCRLELEDEIKKDNNKLISDLTIFSEKYKGFNSSSKECNYFAIKLNSDAKIDIKDNLIEYKTTAEYKKIWQKVLGINEDFKIHKIYSETFYFRGYDMSKPSQDKREKPVYMVEKGSVFVFETKKSFEEVINYFNELGGIGEERENGFGEVQFYFGGVN